jgi:DNA-directed RNA polymerase
VAYITLSTLFNSLVETNDKAKIATAIGAQLSNEARFHYVSKTQPQAWKRLVSYAKEHGSARHQTRFIFNTAAKSGIDAGEEWDFKDRTLLGEWLLGLLEEAELITIRSDTVKGRTRSEILIQDHVLAWLEEYREKADAGSLPMITPLYAPMTTVPRDWSTPFNGGYETLRYRLVSRGLADYRAADMSRVYQAVNAMQHTAWRIHPGMLELITRLWSEGTKVGKLPLGVQQAVPDRVPTEDWEQMAPEERKARALELRAVHNQNRQAASDQITVNMILAQARELVDEPAIYMPYYLDFRGRAYCQPLLNPQSAGFTRSMMEFAHGKPLASAELCGSLFRWLRFGTVCTSARLAEMQIVATQQTRSERGDCRSRRSKTVTTGPSRTRSFCGRSSRAQWWIPVGLTPTSRFCSFGAPSTGLASSTRASTSCRTFLLRSMARVPASSTTRPSYAMLKSVRVSILCQVTSQRTSTAMSLS